MVSVTIAHPGNEWPCPGPLIIRCHPPSLEQRRPEPGTDRRAGSGTRARDEIWEKTQVQTWVCDYSLPVSWGQPSPAYTGRLWAQYWVFTTQWPRHRRAESFTACESRICWIWSAASQLSQLTSELSRVFNTDLSLQRLVLVKCWTVVSNSHNNNNTCWPSGVQRRTSDWWVHTHCKVT